MIQKVADLITVHWPSQEGAPGSISDLRCMGCDWCGRFYNEHAEHVAEVLEAAGVLA